jgi:hypothetical protein
LKKDVLMSLVMRYQVEEIETAIQTEHQGKRHKPLTTTQDQAELSQKLEQVLQHVLAES